MACRDDRRDLREVPAEGDRRDQRARRRDRARRGRRAHVPVLGSGPPARGHLPAQVRAAAGGGAGGRRVLRPRRPGAAQVAAAAARRPAGGLRHELPQVRRRRRGRRRGRGSSRELHIVQPKLVVVDGRGRARVPERARVPARRPSSSRRSASSSASRRRSRRSYVPDIDASLDEAAGEDARSGTPSRRSAPGGPSCRRTEPRRAPRSSRSRSRSASTTRRTSRCSGCSLWWDVALLALVLIPAVFGARLARAAAWRDARAGCCSPRLALRRRSRSCCRLRRPRRVANFAKLGAATFARLVVPRLLRGR